MSSLMRRLGQKKSYKLKRHPKTNWRQVLTAAAGMYRKPVIPRSQGARGEVKSFDIAQTSISLLPVANPPTGISLFQPILGNDYFHRQGRKCSLKSVHVKIRWELGGLNAGVPVDNIYKYVLLYDNQPNAALPAFADVFQDANAGAVTSIDSGFNLNNRDRFKILRSYTWSWCPNANGAGVVGASSAVNDGGPRDIDWFVPMKGAEVNFNAADGGTIADITSGSLILFVTAANNTGSSSSLLYQSRVRYTDV